MRRKDPALDQAHNHEAWAIPYGDLVTLLLAFFVVMYATSSLNEGKYRVLSGALSEAFGGAAPTMLPASPTAAGPAQLSDYAAIVDAGPKLDDSSSSVPLEAMASQDGLQQVADEIQSALAPLLAQDLVAVRLHHDVIEIEMRSDILFGSGSAEPSHVALRAVNLVSAVLKPLDYSVRVEGHTDDQAIRTLQYPSNWELSAARAARVVREFAVAGLEPSRFSIVGYGQYRPVASNGDEAGRNANRRVVLTLLPRGDRERRESAGSRNAETAAAPAVRSEAAMLNMVEQPDLAPPSQRSSALPRSSEDAAGIVARAL